MFIGRTDAEAEVPILWLPHVKSWLIGKDPDAGRDWGQEEEGMTEDEMAGWHQPSSEFEWTPGVGDGQGGLVCCNSRGYKESDTTERLNWTEGQILMYTPVQDSKEDNLRMYHQHLPFYHVHRVLKARIVEWFAILSSSGAHLPCSHVWMWAQSWGIDVFELWCWRSLLRVPRIARGSNQSSLKKGINPEYSLEGLMLKLQYFGHLIEEPNHWKRPWGWVRLRAGGEDETAGWHHRCNGYELGQTMGDSERQGGLVCCSPWGQKESDMTSQLTTTTTNNI